MFASVQAPVVHVSKLTKVFKVPEREAGLRASLRSLVNPRSNVGIDNMSGVVGIVRILHSAAEVGMRSVLMIVILLNVNLAILNLLPIPVLDGGQIVINVLETIKGKPFSLKTRENILRGGLLVIAGIFALVMFNDISRNIEPITRVFARLFGRGA